MTIGIGLAIIIATVLFLIDRNHAWGKVWSGSKVVFKIAVVVAAVGLIGAKIIHNADNRQRERAAAEYARQQAADNARQVMQNATDAADAKREADEQKRQRDADALMEQRRRESFGNARVLEPFGEDAYFCAKIPPLTGFANSTYCTAISSARIKVLRQQTVRTALNTEKLWSQVQLLDGRTGYMEATRIQMDGAK
jgi:Zn-dependent protease with chaperone function